jgi:gliding motility-associated protein GldL
MKGKKWKSFMAKLYGWGASVVIIGALFKIQHWPFAGILLTIGLFTEAVIFFFSAFEPPHEDPDWSLVYPELAGMHGEEKPKKVEKAEDKGSLTQQLDNMLEEAKIGPELLESLGSGLRSLSDSATKMSDISDASLATNEYVAKVKGASSNVSQLSDAYARAAESLGNLNVSAEEGETYGEQLKQISQRLSQLNSTYQLQAQGSEEFTQAQTKLYGGITALMENLNASLDDTKKYKEEVAQLAENLSALNTVYGNMLSAMSGRGNA